MDIAPLSPPSSWIMQQASNWPAGARLIDIASGQGRHSTALAAAYPDRFDILAVDRDQAALAALKARCSDITTCHFDLVSLFFSSSVTFGTEHVLSSVMYSLVLIQI